MWGRSGTPDSAAALGPTPSGLRALGTLRISRYQAALAAVLFVVLVFYVWTGASTFAITFNREGYGAWSASAPGLSRGAYGLLTRALLHGHLYLPVHPDAGFLALKHPYQTGGMIQNKRYHDLVWYHGHFYSAWGPSAVIVFLAFKLITFGALNMSQTLAVALYCFAGVIGAVAVLHLLVRRFLPRTPGWLLLAATVGLALSNIAPYLLRRPAQYEVAISGAYAFEMLGLWLLTSALLNDHRWRTRLAFGSLLLGLAVAARPTTGAGLVLIAVAILMLLRGGRDRREMLLCALGPFVFCLVLVFAYNALRFGSPSDFGYAYQLAAPPVDGRKLDDLAYLAPGLFGYVVMPPRLSVQFPYVSLLLETQNISPFKLPAEYAGGTGGWPLEPAGGLLPSAPVVLMVLALPWMWLRSRWRRGDPDRMRSVATGSEADRHGLADPGQRAVVIAASSLTLAGLVALLLVTLGMWLTTERYEMDYTSYFLIGAFLTWAVLWSRYAGRLRIRRAVSIVGVLLTAIGCLVGIATSLTGPFGLLATEHPALFNSLEDTLAPIPTAVTKLAGHPMIASIAGPDVQTPTDIGPFDLQENDATITVLSLRPTVFTIVAPSTRRYYLVADVVRQPGAVAGGIYAVRVRDPSGEIHLVKAPARGQIRIPLSLGSGVNRVKLTLAGPRPTKPFFLLAAISVKS